MSIQSSTTETAFTSTYAPAAPQRGLFARIADILVAGRMRQAEREVARYIAETGGKFTDESEREIERRFLSSASRL